MNPIVRSAWAAAFGKLRGLPADAGMCLAAVRVIVEDAYGWPSHELYARYLTAGTGRRSGTPAQRLAAAQADPWAADFEASMKQQGFVIPNTHAVPGDLVFNHNAAVPFGHVAVVIAPGVVLENIDPAFRPGSIHLKNSLSLTPLESQAWTLTARLPVKEN